LRQQCVVAAAGLKPAAQAAAAVAKNCKKVTDEQRLVKAQLENWPVMSRRETFKQNS
jgi:hypothetical protein